MVHFLSNNKIKEYFPDLSESELTEINDSITNIIHEYCNTTFEEVAYTDEILDSSYEVYPEHRPIITVSSLVDNSVTLDEDVDFYTYPDRIILVTASMKRKALKLSYSAGFNVVPETVKSVALELLKFRTFKDTEGSLLFYKAQAVEEREYEIDRDLNEETILSRLDRYVQPRIFGRVKRGIKVGYMI